MCRLFRQPLVPVISSQDGRWLLPQPGMPMLKPGGHGVIWKLMQDEGVFQWLASLDRQAAIVRQIRCVAMDATKHAATAPDRCASTCVQPL